MIYIFFSLHNSGNASENSKNDNLKNVKNIKTRDFLFVKRNFLYKGFTLMLTFLLMYSSIIAADKDFTGPGIFSDATKWDGSALPAAGDNLRINGTCTFDNSAANLAYGTLNVGLSVTGSLDWPVGATNTLQVTGISSTTAGSSIDMTNGGTLQVSGTWTTANQTFTWGTGTVIFAATATMPAAYTTFNNLTISAGTVTLSFTTTVNGNLLISGGTLAASTFTLNIMGNFTNNSTFNAGTSTVNFNGTNALQTISGSSTTTFYILQVSKGAQNRILEATSLIGLSFGTNPLVITSGTFKLSSASTIKPITNNLTPTIPASGGFWNNGGTITGGNFTWLIDGLFRNSAGTTNIGTNSGNSLSYRAGATITFEGGNVNIAGRLARANDNSGATVTYTQSGGTVTVVTVGSASGTYAGFDIGATGSSFTMSNGSVVIQKATSNASDYLNIASTHNVTGGTLQIGNASTSGSLVIRINSTVPIYNLLVNANGTPTAQLVTNGLTVKNDVTISTGSTLDIGTYTCNRATPGGTLIVAGTMKLGASTGGQTGSNFPTNFTTLTLTGGTVDYNGSNAMTQYVYRPPTPTNYAYLTLTNGTGSGTAAKTISATPLVNDPLLIDNDLIINLGSQFTVPVLEDVTVGGISYLKSPECLWLKSDITGSASFIDNGTITYFNSGTAKVERYLTSCYGLSGKKCWHYVTMPVTSAVSGVFRGDFMKSYDVINGKWSGYYTHGDTPLNLEEGYAVSEQGMNGVPPHDNHYFIGQLNTAVPAKSLLLTTTSPTDCWNLVGNPYPSAIDFNAVPAWTNVDKIIWYLDQASGNYLVYLDQGLGNTGTRYIPNMQGVFVHVTGTSPSIIFPNSARVHNHEVSFYKELQAGNDMDVLYLKVQGDIQESYDLASIVFREYATSNYENNCDALKLFGNVESPQLYTVSDDSSSLTINSLPFAGRNTTIPVNFKVTENGTGNYSLTISNLESFRAGITITLEDKKTNTFQELTSNPAYDFNYYAGDDPQRFLLHFYNPYFGINESDRNADLQIYSNGKDIYVKDITGTPANGDLYIYNMLGQELTHKQLPAISLIKYTLNLPGGYYVIRLTTMDKTYNSKVYLD